MSDRGCGSCKLQHKGLTQQTDLLNQLRDQMRSLDIEILTEEAGVGDFKRSASKHFLTLKFGGLLEFAEKATVRCPSSCCRGTHLVLADRGGDWEGPDRRARPSRLFL